MVDDPSDPPRKFYGLKPREFDRVNPSTSGQAAPLVTTDAGVVAASDPSRPIDVRELNQVASVPGQVLLPGRQPAGNNEVQSALRANFEREKAAGLFKVADRPRRKSKRTRDYFRVMIIANLALTACAVGGYRTSNAVLFVSSVAGIGLISASLTWVMFFVMDDY